MTELWILNFSLRSARKYQYINMPMEVENGTHADNSDMKIYLPIQNILYRCGGETKNKEWL